MQPAAEHPHAGDPGLLGYRLRSLDHVGQLLPGKVIAPSSNEIRYRVISRLLVPAACSGCIRCRD
jgi:hypothetical protein